MIAEALMRLLKRQLKALTSKWDHAFDARVKPVAGDWASRFLASRARAFITRGGTRSTPRS